uniref:ribonucleoside-diphosphate reductase n=1 Tax=viral metagenome TaxID=1070528 RepID=A0A6C0FAV5_9ZZZZ
MYRIHTPEIESSDMSAYLTDNTSNEDASDMIVIKRNGESEVISFDKILNRVKKLGKEAGIKLNYTSLVMKVIDQLYNNIHTTKIDELAAEHCAVMSSHHPDYGTLAGRIVISNHQKNTSGSFYEVTHKLYYELMDNDKSLLNDAYFQVVSDYREELENMIDYDRDYLIDYFGFKTLERSYLFRIDSKIVERPQHMWMRVAVAIHGKDMVRVKESYDLMSNKYFTHATPTLFNAGTRRQQMSSCYLIAMEDDSLDGIFNTVHDCARISKWAGGIGLHIHNIRANNTRIKGTNGLSSGLVPMLKVFNDTARFINQGGRRNGSFAVYLEPWHPDIEDFLDMKKNHGDEEKRARDLFYGLWIPDLFMEKVVNSGDWCLFCPHKCPGLSDLHSDAFREKYEEYERAERYNRKIPARDLWFKILDAQMETGTPYLLYKDACNKKSNQQNIGTIKSSNLCCEIVEYSDAEETAVCNLASIALPSFVNLETKEFDYNKLHEVTQIVTENLNNIIDFNFYPTDKTQASNSKHRPIGIGVQGLADTFILMDIPFHSEEAKCVNKNIFETMYHGALVRSNEIAMRRYKEIKEKYYDKTVVDKTAYDMFTESEAKTMWEVMRERKTTVGAYSSFEGSPLSQGKFQFDLWGVKPSDRYDWTSLRDQIMTYGTRNSLLLAPMPTASTSQILGFNECFEPFTSNLYSRRTLAGEFVVANKYLMRDLIDLGVWNEDIKNNIVANRGSVQQLTMLPDHIREKYKIVWEIPMKHVINMAADRGAFICQSQSMNLWMEEPTYKSLTSMHFYSWEKGLKTGIYYLRRKARHQAQQFTIEPPASAVSKNKEGQDREEMCEMCSA